MFRGLVLGWVAVVVALLAACGGGGGAGGQGLDPALLTVQPGSGGTVLSVGAERVIDCGQDCTEEVKPGTLLTLQAVAATGFKFVSWSEPCVAAGPDACQLKLDGDLTLAAKFEALPITRTLTVSTGVGGLVTWQGSTRDCSTACSQVLDDNAAVTLIATPKPGYRFVGWTGANACTDATPVCELVVNADLSVTANFLPVELTVNKTGFGTVMSLPAGVNCGAVCAANFNVGTDVTLNATPDAGQVFVGWSGACTGAGPCRVAMDTVKAVTATFTGAPQYALSVSVSGSGNVNSMPAGIQCGSQCSAAFAEGSVLSLSATPAVGYQFQGWTSPTSACTGQGICTVTLRSATSVQAVFALIPPSTNVLSINGVVGGRVTAAAVGIDCGAACSSTVPVGTSVTLTAVPQTNYSFTGWSGACAGSAASCTLTVTANPTVGANFTPIVHTLTINKTGLGTVTSSPAGINCGASCAANFNVGTAVTLSAVPSTGQVFSGWVGACTGTGPCQVTMDAAKTVTATFAPVPQYTLSVSSTGAGSVSSLPAGIQCGSQCAASGLFAAGTVVSLAATPAADYQFQGWTSPTSVCSGTGVCTITMNSATSVQAVFALIPPNGYALTVNSTPGGRVTAPSVGIDCGSACSSVVVTGTQVTLTATPQANYSFTWGGACSGSATTCTVTVASNTTVSANFVPIVRTLTVTRSGAGVVTSTPAGINCGTSCASSFNQGTVVNLSATPNAGQLFSGWSGACAGTGSCQVTMDGAKAVSAVFVPVPQYTLSVSMIGSGSVNSTPAGIQCGTQCSAAFADGTLVSLSATPAAGYQFQGWTSPTSACGGQGVCTVTLRSAVSVQAVFMLIPPPTYGLTVNGAVGGSVTAAAVGIDCGATCSNGSVVSGTSVTLTAVPQANYSFAGWSGACAGSATTCVLTVTANTTVGASFTPIMRTLTVSKSGAGLVTSTPAGINCGSSCSMLVTQGSVVSLSASPESGYQFSGWTGGGCSGTAACQVTLDVAKTVTATFAQVFQTVAVVATGAGTVTSSPAGISCGSNCSASYAQGSNLTLSAAPGAGLSVGGWTGACASASGQVCSLTVNSALSVGVSFVDLTPPSLLSTSPATGGSNVAVDASFVATYSEAINCASFTSAFSLLDGVTPVTGAVSCSGAVATFTPSAALGFGKTYAAQVAAGVRDAAGNASSQTRSVSFSTVASAPTQSFSFLAYGDSRAGGPAPAGCVGNQVHTQLVSRMAAESAAMVFHLGDMVTGYDATTNWVQAGATCPDNGSLKNMIQPLTSKPAAAGLPAYFFPVIGNHDDNWGSGWYPDKLGDGFCGAFPSFQDVIPNHTQQPYFQDTAGKLTNAEFKARICSTTDQSVYSKYMYHSFNYKNSHFVVMRLNNDSDDLMACAGSACGNLSNYSAYYNKHQLDWLRSDLAAATANAGIDNVFVFLHAPMITDSDGHLGNASTALLAKEFSKYAKIKLVFSGHNHAYERSVPVNGISGQPVAGGVGDVVYVVTGGGGSELHGFRNVEPLITVKQARNHYMRIEVDGTAVRARAIDIGGVTIDDFTR